MLYALSSLVYTQQEVCIDLIKYKKELKLVLIQLKEEVGNRLIIESGACLIANLSYSHEEIKEILRELQVIPVFIFLFESVLQKGDLNTFKQILRVFGNLSLSVKCVHELIDSHFISLAIKMV
jgi:hypothetical protein